MADRLSDLTKRYDSLAPHEVADLATLGIGRGEAQRIADMIAKHGQVDELGHFDPHLEKWDTEAHRDFELALLRDMNRAVNTPDVGDTPRLMSTPIGSMLLSFQTFAFTFLNQAAYPMFQRMGLFREKQAMMSLGILLGSALMVLVGKDIINGRDPSKRFEQSEWLKTSYELVDRSGLIGYLSPYVDSALKLSSGVTGFAGGDRYVRNGWLESMLGINFALMSDIQKAGAGLYDKDPQSRLNKVLAIMPYAFQQKLLARPLGALIDNQ